MGDGIHIQDLGSGNGVYVGPLRVDDHLLEDGDMVRIGRQQNPVPRGCG